MSKERTELGMTSRFGPEKLKTELLFPKMGKAAREADGLRFIGGCSCLGCWFFFFFFVRGGEWGRNSILDTLTLKCLVDILVEF